MGANFKSQIHELLNYRVNTVCDSAEKQLLLQLLLTLHAK